MRGLPIALVMIGGCQRTTAPPPPEPAPAVAPAPTPELGPAKVELVDASPAPAEAVSDAGAAPTKPPCAPVAKPPTYDATLRFSFSKGAPGTGMAGIDSLVATVSIPSLKVARQVWESPAPTSCSARQEGEEMAIHCITDEGTLSGRVRIAGEELIIEAGHGLPPGVSLEMGKPVAPPKPRLEPLLTVEVPCGARLRVQAASRDYR